MDTGNISIHAAILPKISVIIPTYNGGRYIGKTIESALNQTFQDIEVIIVDDGSTENLNPILRPYIGKIKYVYIRNQGPAAARNIGIKLSRGDFIALLDHDDVWAPNYLQQMMDILENNPTCSLVYSYPKLIDSEDQIINHKSPSYFPSGKVFLDFLKQNRITTFSATLIRKNIFDIVGLLDEKPEVMTCDDYDIWLKIADKSEVIFCPYANIYYRIHDKNLVGNYEKNFKAHLYVFWRALFNLKSVIDIPLIDLFKILNYHLYHKYSLIAYRYYYDENYYKARNLLFKCLILKPLNLKNWLYLFISILPIRLIEKIKIWKKFRPVRLT